MTTDEPWRSLYPFESHYAEIGGHRMHYLDEGSGPPLLMVHGNPTWSFYWRDLVLALRGSFRVVVPDHVGCGLSDKPSRRDYSFRLDRRIGDLSELVRRLELGDVTLIAHDWGGAIGMGTAVELPQRFSRFVLMNTAAFRSRRIPRRIRICRVPVLGRLPVQGLNLFARAALRMAACRQERMTEAVRAGYLAPYHSWHNRLAIQQFVLDVPLSARHPSYSTLERVESGLAQFRENPVCLIWGMRDWCFTPHFLERFLDFFPQAEVHRLAEAGHYLVEDAHEQIAPIIEAFALREPSSPLAGGRSRQQR